MHNLRDRLPLFDDFFGSDSTHLSNKQIVETLGKLPKAVVGCVGGKAGIWVFDEAGAPKPADEQRAVLPAVKLVTEAQFFKSCVKSR